MRIIIVIGVEEVYDVLNYQDWVITNGKFYEEGKSLLTLKVNATQRWLFDYHI